MLGSDVLRASASHALRLKLRIDAGENSALLKIQFCEELESKFGLDFVDFVLTFERTFSRQQLEMTVNNFQGGNYANINLGKQFGTVNATINAIPANDVTSAALMQALRQLTQSIEKSTDLSTGEKQEALESIETIAGQAALPQEERKPGWFKPAMAHLPTVLSASVNAMKIWEIAHPILVEYFHL